MLKPIIVTTFALAILGYFIPTISFTNIVTLLIASLVITLLNSVVKPVLKLLFLPVNIITFGFFSWVINISLLWLATYLVPGFSIEPMIIFGVALNQFFSLLVVSAAISFLSGLIGMLL